jgi:hypothetical protein
VEVNIYARPGLLVTDSPGGGFLVKVGVTASVTITSIVGAGPGRWISIAPSSPSATTDLFVVVNGTVEAAGIEEPSRINQQERKSFAVTYRPQVWSPEQN